MRGRLLIVDDDREMCELLDVALRRRGFSTLSTTSADDAFRRLTAEEFDVVVTDLNMAGMDGAQLCERIVANRPHVPVVVITAFGSLETAVAAIRAGAYDFVTKPFEPEQLAFTLDRAVQHRRLREEVATLKTEATQIKRHSELLGESPCMLALHQLIERVAPTEVSVLLAGPTGAGKELIARALHDQSPRAEGPFVAINCSAVPESLLESELFGHTKGAFTDARIERRGLFQQASGGTLFLDEITDMPLALQPKLLRALQERRARPVGSDVEAAFDARIISATNRDPEAAVKEGRLREDLFFRINVIQIDVPPLRARGNDVLLLAQRFIERDAARSGKGVKGLTSGAAASLLAYSWPGNVRELQNCMERAVAITEHEHITVEDLPEKVRSYRQSRLPLIGDAPDDLPPLEEIERRYIQRVLEAVGGSKTTAAQILGMDRKTLYRKLERSGPGADGHTTGE